ncbi:hypothetical protein GCM10010145_13310 [Streptomyces ruber]|uniref:DUF559 domain-containing protein n=2 Tax=Streptomyces TaxID=1883 RepID=A0A918B8Z7_9ACTN|nr:hypothetical protein [Streptomyces ruber]GGQ45946.1 hypothetical protein GCM10010145_13310 [Streptomyces ruber]
MSEQVPSPAPGPTSDHPERTANDPTITNQARAPRREARRLVEDRLHFTNEDEHRVYQALKRWQAALPDNETIGIMPLGGMRVRGNTFEPDFLVTYRGRAAVIEVDGSHHKGRAAADHSRDRLLVHAGVVFVERLVVEDATEPAEIAKFVSDFLARLKR